RELCEFGGHKGSICSVAFAPDSRTMVTGSADSTILVWDVTGRLDNGRLRSLCLAAPELEARWERLAGDAAAAYRAVWEFGAAPEQAVPLLKGRLRPVPRVSAEQIARWIADLDSDHFPVRQRAMRELEHLEELAEPALRQALEKRPSAEVQRQAKRLLEQLTA